MEYGLVYSQVIKEDGELEWCGLCNMFSKDLTKHQRSATCKKGRNRRINESKQSLQFQADKVKFFVNGKEIERVFSFKYLGQIFTENDDDSPCIREQICKARSRWNNLAKILKHEGANAEVIGQFYLAIVQAVLLYGAGL